MRAIKFACVVLKPLPQINAKVLTQIKVLSLSLKLEEFFLNMAKLKFPKFSWWLNKAGFIIQASDNSGNQEPPEWVLVLLGMFVSLSVVYAVSKASEYVINYFNKPAVKKEPKSSETSSETAKNELTQSELDNYLLEHGMEPIDLKEFEELRIEKIIELKAGLEKLAAKTLDERRQAELDSANGVYMGPTLDPHLARKSQGSQYEVDLRIQFREELAAALNWELDELNKPGKDPRLIRSLYIRLKEFKDFKEGIDREGNPDSQTQKVTAVDDDGQINNIESDSGEY